MNIHQLEAFKAVVETQSFSTAAKELHITQSGITQLIQSLEKELNTTFFIRSKRPVALTDDAHIYYPYVKSMLQLYDDSLKALSNNKTKNFTLSYRITSEGIIDRYLFSKPDIDLPEIQNISHNDFNSVQNWKENTLYFVREDIVSSKNITFIPIHTSKVYAAVSTNSVLTKKEQLTVDDIKGRTVLLPKTSSRTVLANKLSQLFKKYPEIIIREVDQGFDLSLRYVAMQDLIAFSTEEFLRRHQHIKYIEFKTDFHFTYGFACIGTPSKDMRIFIDSFKSWKKTAS